MTGLAIDGTQINQFRDLMDVRKSNIVVGTSQGRVLKLRRHLTQDEQLVPAAVIWSNHGLRNVNALPRSSPLGVLPGSHLLMLHDTDGKVQAIDMKTGTIVGEWQLPQTPGYKWSGVAGGGGFLYVTRVGQSGMASELWQFPLPQLDKHS
jgi:outer membrane protein assembly factor BamB